MKISLIGGGGVRTPLLVEAFCRSDLPIETIALYDTDRDRAEAMASISRQLAGGVEVAVSETSADSIQDSDFVFTSIRVGGIESRARDEVAAQAHGIAGQETVAPGGWAMALRNAPHVLGYAKEVEKRAPHAWLVNFTNPVSIVTQVVRAETSAKIVGICDTPTALFAETARVLGVERSQCYFDYFGLNHLGWLREVYYRGEPLLQRLWSNPQTLTRLYRAPLFESEFLLAQRLLPTEYLYYYYFPRDAFENTRKAGQTRAQVIERLNRQLFRDLAGAGRNPVEVYRAYIADREAGYLQIEAGKSAQAPELSIHDPTTGYHRIALAVVRAVHFNAGTILPLNVPNRQNLPFLQDKDIVEVPCVVNVNGPMPLHVKPAPEPVAKLMAQVKDYERLTVQAVLAHSRDIAIKALARHPLVENLSLARDLYEALETS